jgi:hypothetical protein
MRVCRNNKFAESSLANSNSVDAVRIKLRILQIFALECALQQYRLKLGTRAYALKLVVIKSFISMQLNNNSSI